MITLRKFVNTGLLFLTALPVLLLSRNASAQDLFGPNGKAYQQPPAVAGGGGGGGLVQDSTNTTGLKSGVASISWPHTNTGSSITLFVGVMWDDTATSCSVTYAGTSMTRLWMTNAANIGALEYSSGFVLGGAATGSNLVVATFSGGSPDTSYGVSIDWTGGNTSSPARTAASLESDGTPISVTAPGAIAGDVVINVVQAYVANSSNDITNSAGQTLLYHPATHPGSGVVGVSWKDGASGGTMTWTTIPGAFTAIGAVAIKAGP